MIVPFDRARRAPASRSASGGGGGSAEVPGRPPGGIGRRCRPVGQDGPAPTEAATPPAIAALYLVTEKAS